MGLFGFGKKKNNVNEEAEAAAAEALSGAAEAGEAAEGKAEEAAGAAEAAAQGAEAAAAEGGEAAGEAAPSGLPDGAMRAGAGIRVFRIFQDLPDDSDDAKLVSYLIDRHRELKTAESLNAVLEAVQNVSYIVPMNMRMHIDDAKRFKELHGKNFKPKHPVQFIPQPVQGEDGQVFLPAFVTKEDVPEDNIPKFTWALMPSIQCGGSVLRTDKVNGLLLNPFSTRFLMKRELLEKMIKVVKTEKNDEGAAEGTDGAEGGAEE